MSEQDFELQLDPVMDSAEVPVQKQKKRRLKKRISLPVYFLSLLLAIVFAFAAVFVFYHSGRVTQISAKLQEIDRLVNRYYTGELDYDVLDDAVLSAYMKAIGDKYGFYESLEDAEAVSDSFTGDASGIGITVYYDAAKQGLSVFRVDSASPAEQAGLKIGDCIIAVDGKTVAEVGYTQSVRSIQRELGQTVTLTLLRAEVEQTAIVTYSEFVRQTVYAEQIGTVGYLCFTAFNDATVAQFHQAMDEFLEAGVTGLIFDVRDNGGGTVEAVCEILDRLVGECDLMTVEYVDGKKRVTHTSDEKQVDLPMAVLVNESTASASELFAATIRDMGKGALVGTQTYGKGVMQRTYFLTDGSCVRFTVGKFYPAGGVNFNEVGLTPEVGVELTEEQAQAAYLPVDADPFIQSALAYLKQAEES